MTAWFQSPKVREGREGGVVEGRRREIKRKIKKTPKKKEQE